MKYRVIKENVPDLLGKQFRVQVKDWYYPFWENMILMDDLQLPAKFLSLAEAISAAEGYLMSKGQKSEKVVFKS